MRAWHLGAVICGAKTCYLGATYYGADPRVYFCKKLQKGHICEILSRKGLNCKNYGRSPRSWAARAGRPAAGRPAPMDLRAIYSAKFFSEMPLPPRCRAAGTWPPGSRATWAYLEKKTKKLQTGPWGPVARQRGGRPPRPPGSWGAGFIFYNLALFAK